MIFEQIWLKLAEVSDIIVDLIRNSLIAIRFLFQAPILSAGVYEVMPTFIGVAMIHVIAIAVLKAIFMR